MRQSITPPNSVGQKLFLCVADHFEPLWGRPSESAARERVETWHTRYPCSIRGLVDSRGRPPQHTFFFPIEEYRAVYLDRLADLVHRGFGDVEVHLHHDNDTSDHLGHWLMQFIEKLFHAHGLLAKGSDGRITYGFIHGNWALDNSRPDGRWCGVNDEITILIETGCYADFTMPCAPAPGQTRITNSIYYATDDPLRPKSHDQGVLARVGRTPPENSLLLVQGPLALDWKNRKWGLLPRVENGDLHGGRPPTLNRLRLWLDAAVTVADRWEWRFVKLHTHGAQEVNAAMLLGEPMRHFHESLALYARENPGFEYFYVTAREMAGLVHQAEAGITEPDWQALSRVNTA